MKELITQLPERNQEAAQKFCNDLRARIKNNGVKTESGGNVYKFSDRQTGISVLTTNREQVENAWFSINGFLNWAQKNGLPLAYIIRSGIHAQLLLKLEKKGKIRLFLLRSSNWWRTMERTL